MKREQYPTLLQWVAENSIEYQALGKAEDGDQFPLAEFIERNGVLATKEARAFVAARLRGDRKPSGVKRTIRQQVAELEILVSVRKIQQEEDCLEYRALGIYLDRHPDMIFDTLKTNISRAKKTLEDFSGCKITPVVQKRPNSKP